jgi:predicted outer membrane protein
MRRPAKFLLAAFLAVSCGKTSSPDPKVIAEEHNDAKFNDPAKEKDSQFLVNTAAFYVQEIELSKLAQENSTDKKIQSTGKTLEKEYRDLYSSLKDLCTRKGISIPSEPGNKEKHSDNKLSYEIAEDFDKQFLDQVIKAHREAMSVHTARGAASDPDVQAFAILSLQRIRKNFDFVLLRHHDTIQALN